MLGSHQKARYCWYNKRIQDFIDIDINSQPNLDVAMKKYGMFKQVRFHCMVTTRDDPEYGLAKFSGNLPKFKWIWGP
jgi:hypothetical protein